MYLTLWTVSFFHIIQFVFSSAIGNAHPNISISVRGIATTGQLPFFASLPFTQQTCSGTLINPSYVLTAAHCVSMYTQTEVKSFSVYLNTLTPFGKEPEAIQVGVSSYVIHEGFSINAGITGYINDIALVVLSQPVTAVNPVPFPRDSATTTKAKTTTTTTPKTTTNKTTKTTTTNKPATKTTPKTTPKTTTNTTTKTTNKTTTKTTPKTTPKTTTKTATTTTKPTTKTPTSTKTTKPTTKTTLKTTQKQLITTQKQSTTKKPALRGISTYANAVASVAEWGMNVIGPFNFDIVVMVTNFTISDNDVCTSKWGSNAFDGNSMICADGNDSSSDCPYYSNGGPILVDGVQVGMTSFPSQYCNNPNVPAVFTRVSAYLNWIDNAMAANPPPSAK